MAVATPAFTGFRPEAIQFLADLASNNDRAWFQPRKGEYESLLKEPLEALIAALAERFEARGIPLRADPAKSPFRIYRDVRFSKDKSPYKTNIGASFPWVGETSRPMAARDRTRRTSTRVAGTSISSRARSTSGAASGTRRSPGSTPSGAVLRTIRMRSARSSAIVRSRRPSATSAPTATPFSVSRPVIQPTTRRPTCLKLKDVVFGRRLSDADATSPGLPDVIADSFAAGLPMMRFLAAIG